MLPLAVAKEFLWVVIGQSMAAAAGFAGVRFLTQALDPAQYGELALALTVSTFIQQSLFGPLSMGAMRYYAVAAENDSLGDFLRAVGTLACAAILIVFAIIVSLCPILWQSDILLIFNWTLIFSILVGVNGFIDGMQNAKRERAVVALHQGASQCLRYLLAPLASYLVSRTATMAMVGFAAAVFLVLFSQCYFFFKGGAAQALLRPMSTRAVLRYVKISLKYSWPFMVWGSFEWMRFSTDRWALEYFFDSSAVGRYAVLFQLGFYPPLIISGMLSQLVSPILFNRAGDGLNPKRMASVDALNKKITLGLFGGSMVLAGVATFFYRPFWALFAASPYQDVAYLLPWMLLRGGLYATAQMATIRLICRPTPAMLIPQRVGAAFLSFILAAIGARFSGIEGVVYGGVLAACLDLGWVLCLARRIEGKRSPWSVVRQAWTRTICSKRAGDA